MMKFDCFHLFSPRSFNLWEQTSQSNLFVKSYGNHNRKLINIAAYYITINIAS